MGGLSCVDLGSGGAPVGNRWTATGSSTTIDPRIGDRGERYGRQPTARVPDHYRNAGFG
jgi:hypothetical protein